MQRTVLRGARQGLLRLAQSGLGAEIVASRAAFIPLARASPVLSIEPFNRTFASGITYPPASVVIGKAAPEFTATALIDQEIKQISLKDYRGKWVVLFFYPKDFTFVCPTEITAFSDAAPQFAKLNAQVIAASTDTAETHLAWVRTARKRGGLGHMQIPIIADVTKSISADYGVLIREGGAEGIALRGLFLINPQGVVEQITVNNLPVGRSVEETQRLLQAFQYVAEHGEVCPAGWKPGDKSMKTGDASTEYFSALAEDDGPPMLESLPTLKTPAEFAAFTKGPGAAVVDFYATWCGKCRQIAPHVEELAQQHQSVKFAKVDTDSPAMADWVKSQGVAALPVFKVFKNGQLQDTLVGYKKGPLADAVAQAAK